MTPEVRAAVLARDRWCPWCGCPFADRAAVHHRRLRSQGGDDTVENLVALHPECHNVHPRSVHQNPRDAVERGFIVPSWADPADTPLRLANGRDVLLRFDGTIEHDTTGVDPRWGTST
jgi:hypothetical protein